MSTTTTPITPEIDQYISSLFSEEDSLLQTLRKEAEEFRIPAISIGTIQARFLSVYLRSMGAIKGIEIGSLGGYSAISILRSLPNDGHLHCFELNPEYASFMERQIDKAGFKNNCSIYIGDASSTLTSLPKDELFDFVFIDANKGAYVDYLHQTFPLLKKGGVIIADNTLAWGDIAKTDVSNTVASIQEFNLAMKAHSGFLTTLVPLGDGMTIGVKL